MPNIGPLEIAIVLVIVLIIFGPKRLPGLGKQLGTGMREFKESITGSNKDDEDDDDEGVAGLPAAPDVSKPATTASAAPAAPAERDSASS
jgi:sec-independent protein translocase protein TatA